MKTKLLLFALLVFGSFIISCNKEPETGEDNPNCLYTPTDLAVYDITDTSATLYWFLSPYDSYFDVEYHMWLGPWTKVRTYDRTLKLTGLVPGARYQWRVSSECKATEYREFTTTGGNGCSSTSNLRDTLTTKSSTMLKWDAIPNASGYYVQYNTTGTDPWTKVLTYNNYQALSGLDSVTTYYWQVQTLCSTGDTSAYVQSSFTTK